MGNRLLKIPLKKEIMWELNTEGRILQTHPTEDLKGESFKISEEQVKGSKKELKKEDYTTFQKLLLRIFGRIYVGSEKKAGWSSPLPMYAFICPKHGIQTNYPNSWNKTLLCPKCISEVSSQLLMKHKVKT